MKFSKVEVRLLLNQLLKLWIILNSLNLAGDKSLDILFDMFIVGFDSLRETIGAIFVCEVCNDGDGVIRLHFGRDLGRVHHNLSVENLLLDAFVKIVGDSPHKHPLCEVGDFGSRDKTIELCGDGGRLVIELDSDEPTV